MWVEGLVDDAPSAVDPEHGQIVAVPHAGVLAPDPDQSGVAFEREAIDAPFVQSRFRDRLLAFRDIFVDGRQYNAPCSLPTIEARGWNARASLASSPSMLPS